jgi:bacteriocin biosynthesis cyclodehydratase domain-containing protein
METVERCAFAWRRPWFPVLLEHPYLRCGPVVIPSHTACHLCFRRRRRQHAKTLELWSDRPPAAVAGSAEEVRGFADHHVLLAVGLALQAAREALDPEPAAPGGWVRGYGLTDGAVFRAGVIAADQCRRCRPARSPDATWRALAALGIPEPPVQSASATG